MGAIGSAFKSVQTDKVTLAAGVSTTITISEVSDKAFVISNCQDGACTWAEGDPSPRAYASSFSIGIEITDSTTLTLTAGAGAGSVGSNATIHYSVIDPY